MKLIAIGIVILLIPFLPVPDFLANVGTVTLPSSLGWAWNVFQMDAGLAIVFAAISARFIRRLIMAA